VLCECAFNRKLRLIVFAKLLSGLPDQLTSDVVGGGVMEGCAGKRGETCVGCVVVEVVEDAKGDEERRWWWWWWCVGCALIVRPWSA
jgi:hypothetical protein